MTERDVVLRERAAAAKAIEWVCARARRDYGINSGIDGLDTRRYVEETFPLPKVTRPRVVPDPHSNFAQGWRCVDGAIQYTPWLGAGKDQWFPLAPEKGDCIREGTLKWPTLERIKMWADLLANPNETVEE